MVYEGVHWLLMWKSAANWEFDVGRQEPPETALQTSYRNENPWQTKTKRFTKRLGEQISKDSASPYAFLALCSLVARVQAKIRFPGPFWEPRGSNGSKWTSELFCAGRPAAQNANFKKQIIRQVAANNTWHCFHISLHQLRCIDILPYSMISCNVQKCKGRAQDFGINGNNMKQAQHLLPVTREIQADTSA